MFVFFNFKQRNWLNCIIFSYVYCTAFRNQFLPLLLLNYDFNVCIAIRNYNIGICRYIYSNNNKRFHNVISYKVNFKTLN